MKRRQDEEARKIAELEASMDEHELAEHRRKQKELAQHAKKKDRIIGQLSKCVADTGGGQAVACT